MHHLLSRTLLLSWALWLGGLIGVFLSVTTIFAALPDDKAEAGRIAAKVFGRFEHLALLLAAIALISMLGIILKRGSKFRTAVLSLLMVSALIFTASTLLVSPRILAMRDAHETDTPSFRRMHGASMILYTSTAGLLAITGLLLPNALRREERY